MIIKKAITWISVAAALAGIFAVSPPAYAAAPKKITVTSTAFKNNGVIPVKYALAPEVPGGENISIPVSWKVLKKTAKKIKSFAISIIDLHPFAEKFVHLLAVNIPADVRAIEEGAFTGQTSIPMGTQQLLNTYGQLGYGGPNPPPSYDYHVYEITVYGLAAASVPGINMNNAMDKQYSAAEFSGLLKGKIVAKGKLKGKFKLEGVADECIPIDVDGYQTCLQPYAP